MGIVRDQSIKNSFSFYIGMLIGAINTVILYPNVFQENPEHLGLIQILIAYAVFVATFTTIGIPKTFLRFFPAIKNKGQLFFLSLVVPLFGFISSLLFYFFFKESLFDLLNVGELLRNNFYYVFILVFFIGFYEILTSVSRSYLNAAVPIFINEVFMKLYSLILLLLHWFSYLQFDSFLSFYISGYIIKFGVLLCIQLYHNRLCFSFTLKELRLKEMFVYGLYVLLAGASIMIVTRLDMIMIGSLLDLEQVAFYTIAYFIGNAIKVPSKSIASISVPLLAKAWEEQDFKQINTLYVKSSINQLIIGGILFLCMWINIDSVFNLLPSEFSQGKWVVFFIGISQLFNISTGINGPIIVNSKYYRYDLVTNIILVVVTIISNYILIQKFGINGAAMATALSIFIFSLVRLIIIKIKMNLQPFNIKTIYTILILLVVYFIISSFPVIGIPLIDIAWRSILVFLFFTPLILLLRLSEDIIDVINIILKKILFRKS
tara:strand:+ start:3160 stop:4629 length:1470 start_codon:yes stop_codon:yes gene_type:complete